MMMILRILVVVLGYRNKRNAKNRNKKSVFLRNACIRPNLSALIRLPNNNHNYLQLSLRLKIWRGSLFRELSEPFDFWLMVVMVMMMVV